MFWGVPRGLVVPTSHSARLTFSATQLQIRAAKLTLSFVCSSAFTAAEERETESVMAAAFAIGLLHATLL
jgi:hypothetical protein